MKLQKSHVIPGVIACAFGLVGFLGGMQFQKSQSPTASASDATNNQAQQPPGGFGEMRQGGGQFGGQRPTLGEVTAISSDKITVKTQAGSSDVTLTSETVVRDGETNETIAKDTIKVGDTIIVMGDTSGTSVTAETITVNPSFGGRPGGGMQGQPPGSGDDSI